MTLTRLRPIAALMLVAMLATTACQSSDNTIAEAPGNESDSRLSETSSSNDEFNSSDVSPNSGTIQDGSYSNDYFGFSMRFPTEWAVASQETTEELQELGSEVAAGDDAAFKASLEAAEKNTYQLLMVSEKAIGAPVESFNPNVVVMAEKVSHLPGIKSGAEYLTNVANLLQQTNLPYEAQGTPYEVDIDGQPFYRADFTLNTAGLTIQQSYLATIHKGYALGFILSGTDQTFTQLDEIANSTQFQ